MALLASQAPRYRQTHQFNGNGFVGGLFWRTRCGDYPLRAPLHFVWVLAVLQHWRTVPFADMEWDGAKRDGMGWQTTVDAGHYYSKFFCLILNAEQRLLGPAILVSIRETRPAVSPVPFDLLFEQRQVSEVIDVGGDLVTGRRRVEAGANIVALAVPARRAIPRQTQQRDGVLVEQRGHPGVVRQGDRSSGRIRIGQPLVLVVPEAQQAGNLMLDGTAREFQ